MRGEFYKMYYEDWDEGVECFGDGMAALALNGAYVAAVNHMQRRHGYIVDDIRILARLWKVRRCERRGEKISK